MKRKLYMIRHGRTVANDRNLYYGATDLEVSPEGRAQLKLLRRERTYPDISGCTVYTSGMKRTQETLEVLYPGVTAVPELMVSEMNFGKFEMRSYEEMKSDPEYIAWITGDYLKNVCPEGESPEEHSRRAVEGFRKILSETQGDVMVIAHNGSMTAFMQYLFPDEGENRWYWNSGNGEGFCVEFDGGRPSWYKRIPE